MLTSWTLSDGSACVSFGKWTAELSPTQPSQGLRVGKPDTASWSVLAVHPHPSHSLQPEEVYLRQSDLIARFDQSPGDAFAFQLDWRLLPLEEQVLFGVELWMSIQTDHLDSKPVLRVSSRTSCGEPWEVLRHQQILSQDGGDQSPQGPAALIARPEGYTGVWLVEPSDQRQAELVSTSADSEQCVELLGHFMEKGVIRRARMRFYLIEGVVSAEQLRAVYQDFSNSPLPLTA